MLLADDEWAMESQGDSLMSQPLPQEYSPSDQPSNPGVQNSLKLGGA